jgi:hypothetical protein
MSRSEEIPYPVLAVTDLASNFSDEHLKYAIKQIRDAVARVIAEDNSSDQQIVRVKILRYLDVQLACAARWSTDTADLMALILRRLIELRSYSKFVSTGEEEAGRFLAEADTDSVEMYRLMRRAFPDEMPEHEIPQVEKRFRTEQNEGEEEVLFKLCSKFLHPSAFVMHDMESTILSLGHRQLFACKVVYYGWGILNMFHKIEWIE